MQVTPNKAKTPGVKTKYKLNGNDHTNAIIISNCLDVKDEMTAKQAGRNNIRNEIAIVSGPLIFE